MVDVRQRLLDELRERHAVVRRTPAVALERERHGLLHLVRREQLGDLGEHRREHEGAHLGQHFRHAVEEQQQEARDVGDRARHVADGDDPGPLDLLAAPDDVEQQTVELDVATDGVAHVEHPALRDPSAARMHGDQAFGELAHQLLHEAEVAHLDARQRSLLQDFLAEPPPGIGREEQELALDEGEHLLAQSGEFGAQGLRRRRVVVTAQFVEPPFERFDPHRFQDPPRIHAALREELDLRDPGRARGRGERELELRAVTAVEQGLQRRGVGCVGRRGLPVCVVA